MKHIKLEKNTIGRDYVVGDLQGCYDQLMLMMKKIGFNKSTDRLISVGDLVDRGPRSFDCAQLVYEPWFHATKGNHELLMSNSILREHEPSISCWMQNGGIWFKDEEPYEIHGLAEKFDELPLVISVGEGNDRFNVVHAELLKQTHHATDADIDNWTFTPADEDNMLWGRHIIELRTDPSFALVDSSTGINLQSDELSTTYVGHSIIPKLPVSIDRQIYLDTGCVNHNKKTSEWYRENCTMTIACPAEKVFYTYSPGHRAFAKFDYNKIRHYR